jgi:predicted transcriptional regulator
VKTKKSTKANITLKLDKELLRQARELAAKAGSSISAMLAAELEEVVRKRKYEVAKKRALAVLAEGLDLGGRPLTRDEIHER